MFERSQNFLFALLCLSVHLHASTWLQVNRCLWNLMLETFIRIYQENWSSVRIRQKYWALYM